MQEGWGGVYFHPTITMFDEYSVMPSPPPDLPEAPFRYIEMYPI